MKTALIVGGKGVIGGAVAELFQKEGYDVFITGQKKRDEKNYYQLDFHDENSIISLYKKLPSLDAVICTAGSGYIGFLNETKPQDYFIGINDKLMGQVNMVLLGIPFMKKGGVFTLTSGILADEPVPGTINLSMVSSALEGFVLGASAELPSGLKINIVSPTLIEESSPELKSFFKGFTTISKNKAALAYLKSTYNGQTGQIYKVL